MQINNNLSSMVSTQVQLNQMNSNLADIANSIGDPQFQEVTQDLIDTIAGQIPQTISYEANAKSIETQNAVSDMLLNIKA